MVVLRWMGVAAWVALCLGATAATAAPFKCVHPATGHVTYRDGPCDDAREERPLTIVDNVVQADPKAAVAAASTSTRPSRTPREAAAAPLSGLMTLGVSHPPRGSVSSACQSARRDYEIAVSEIKKDLQTMNRRHREAARVCGHGFEQSPEHESLARRASAKPRHGDAHSRGQGFGSPP